MVTRGVLRATLLMEMEESGTDRNPGAEHHCLFLFEVISLQLVRTDWFLGIGACVEHQRATLHRQRLL